jgi:indoleamine 2,3-dioxygenase
MMHRAPSTKVAAPEMAPANGAGNAVDPRSVEFSRGFLPPVDPLASLPAAFARWDELGHDLPKLLAAGRAGWAIDQLPSIDPSDLTGPALKRAMVILSFLGHAYVWEAWREGPRQPVPRGLAVPWHAVACRLGRPPVLSYASYALDNWRRLDPTGPVDLGNLVLLQNFLGGLDEEWFVAVHVAIEARAAPLASIISAAQNAVLVGNATGLTDALGQVASILDQLVATLQRMPENCDPYVYYHRVRPYIHGFTQHPVVYEGVVEFGGEPQSFHGETGAQSSIIPLLDAALGIAHAPDELTEYLAAMRRYMPPQHRALLEAVGAGPSIRDFVRATSEPRLVDVYDECLRLIGVFRTQHLEFAATYIHGQSQRGANSTLYGTGGTPFMPYLKKHRDETRRAMSQVAKGLTRSDRSG